MKGEWEILGQEGFQFFGKMSASISHEIKNTLAIINENAGLLEDFTIMAEKGLPLNPERLKGLAGKICVQIRRADRIIKNLNRFAHSADEWIKAVDLFEILELVTALSERFAARRSLTLALAPLPEPLSLTTCPFFLENLLWLCLDFVMARTGAGKTIFLTGEKRPGGLQIRFTGIENGDENRPSDFPSPREKALLSVLGGDLHFDVFKREVLLKLPQDLRN
jgi:signal transduction histidine kinase